MSISYVDQAPSLVKKPCPVPAAGGLPDLSGVRLNMKVVQTAIPDVLIVEPTVYRDARGFFCETYNKRDFEKAGLPANFVQDNHSRSARNVLRGLHYQIQQPQGKLVRVVGGAIFDVAVDIRKKSRTFGMWVGVELSAETGKMLWIPEGFAHGYLVLSETAEFLYKTTDYYAPKFERMIVWNDPDLSVAWPFRLSPSYRQK